MSSMGTECRNSPTSSVKALNQDALQSPHVDEVYGKGSLAGGVQEFLPRFNARFAVAAEQPERAYRPVPAELSLTETISLKHTRREA